MADTMAINNIALFGERKREVTDYANRKNVKLYELAHVLGCNDGNLSRKLRYMTAEDVKTYKGIIDLIADAKQKATNEERD